MRVCKLLDRRKSQFAVFRARLVSASSAGRKELPGGGFFAKTHGRLAGEALSTLARKRDTADYDTVGIEKKNANGARTWREPRLFSLPLRPFA